MDGLIGSLYKAFYLLFNATSFLSMPLAIGPQGHWFLTFSVHDGYNGGTGCVPQLIAVDTFNTTRYVNFRKYEIEKMLSNIFLLTVGFPHSIMIFLLTLYHLKLIKKVPPPLRYWSLTPLWLPPKEVAVYLSHSERCNTTKMKSQTRKKLQAFCIFLVNDTLDCHTLLQIGVLFALHGTEFRKNVSSTQKTIPNQGKFSILQWATAKTARQHKD